MNDTETVRIGRGVRFLRNERGLSRKQLGELIGTSETVVRHIETDQKDVSRSRVQQLANALGIRHGSFLEVLSRGTEDVLIKSLQKSICLALKLDIEQLHSIQQE